MEYTVNENCLRIENSYKIEDPQEMEEIIDQIKMDHINDGNLVIWNLSMEEMLDEWMGHNLAYKLHILRSRTSSVDINRKHWAISAAYCVSAQVYKIWWFLKKK